MYERPKEGYTLKILRNPYKVINGYAIGIEKGRTPFDIIINTIGHLLDG